MYIFTRRLRVYAGRTHNVPHDEHNGFRFRSVYRRKVDAYVCVKVVYVCMYLSHEKTSVYRSVRIRVYTCTLSDEFFTEPAHDSSDEATGAV